MKLIESDPYPVMPKRRGLAFNVEAYDAHLKAIAEWKLRDGQRGWEDWPLEDGLCYFITCRDLGLVKIGFSRKPAARRRKLASTWIGKLRLEVTCRGGRTREMHYHRLFAAHRDQGEWFNLTPEIEAEMARLTTLSGDK